MADDTNYMGDGAPDAEAPETPAQQDQQGDSTKTAILPMDFFQGKEPQPGDTCEVTVEAVHDGSVEVSYHSSETADQEQTETETGAEPAEGGGASPDEMMGGY